MKRITYRSQWGCLLLSPVFTALVACGGGGSSSDGGTVTPPAAVNSAGVVSVSGTAIVNETLTGAVSDSNGTSSSTISYQWLSGGTAISGATNSTYTLASSDVGNTVSLNVSYVDNDGFSENITSVATDTVQDVVVENSQGVVTISGLAQVGQIVSAIVTDANGTTNEPISYQWIVDGTDITGATASNYTLSDTHIGETISVMASYTDDDGFSEAITSAPTAPVIAASVITSGGNFARGTLGDKDSVPEINCDVVYTSTSSLESNTSRNMTAGTTLCLADGNYSGLEIDFGGAGTEAAPITIAAENPGGAIIDSGEAAIRMSGSYAVLQGLVFKDVELASSDFLQTRNGSGGDHCNNCRITEVSLIDLQSDNSGIWINIYGQNNRVDHSWITGKVNANPMLIINREIADGQSASDVLPNFTEIDHNYFGDRPPINGKAYAENSDNGYEAIRLGTSPAHAFDSFSSVEYNYFERIEGEAEVISNKSGNNIISNNTIRDSYGSLTTRHGPSATIEGNVIMGDGHPFAGGIRLVDDSHRVINNYIEGARYLNTRFHGGIVIHNGDSSSSNGYQDVSNLLIANNTIVDSVNSLNVNGGNRSVNPTDLIIVNNIIDDAVGPIITQADEGLPTATTYAGNYVDGVSFSDNDDITSAAGFNVVDPALVEDALGISRPTADNSAALAAETAINYESFDPVTDDMDGQARTASTLSGSDHISSDDVTRGLLTFDDVGPINYRPDFSIGYIGRVPLENAGFDDGAAGWTLTGSSSITTTAGDYFAREASVELSGTGRIQQSVSVTPNTNYTVSGFARGPVTLGVDIAGAETSNGSNTSEYRFTSTRFNSGSASSLDVFAELSSDITLTAPVAGASFDNFTANSSDPDWTISEGGTLGQVQSSSNSASGADGSVKFKLNDASELGNQSITQLIEDIVPNTVYTLSAYVLEKNDSDVTATIGVYEAGTTNVVASKILDYAALDAAGAEEGDDSFLLDSFTFNSDSHTSLTLFVTYNPNDVYASGITDSDFTDLRVDDISLTYVGSPDNSVSGFIDDIRVVSHGN